MLHDWEDDDDGDAVDGGEEVVGDAVGVHVRGLGDEVGGHLGLAEPVDDECDAEKQRFVSTELGNSNRQGREKRGKGGLTTREWL